jgi:hypothetical protein
LSVKSIQSERQYFATGNRLLASSLPFWERVETGTPFARDAILMKYSVLVLTVVWLLLSSNEASGESTMRCGSDLISLGDTKLDVISKCGAPDMKEVVGLDTIGVDFGTAFGHPLRV